MHLRLADYVPVVAGSGQRWNDVITGLLRMSYVTDLIRAFEAEGLLSTENHRSIQFEANTAINSNSPDWFERSLATSIWHGLGLHVLTNLPGAFGA